MGGIAMLPDRAHVPCVSQVLTGAGQDHLIFEVPMGGLDAAWPHAVSNDPDDAAAAQR
jgi:hypothetical protein